MSGTQLRIRGGKTLHGSVLIPGAKNAALKQIAAALLTEEPVTLTNVPKIIDVERMLTIVEALGASVEKDWDAHTITITAKDIDPTKLPAEDVRLLRASIVLLGPLLVRTGEVTMPYPGGDKIGARPLTTHIRALEQLGAKITLDGHQLIAKLSPKGLQANHVVLREFSVTATENTLMAAAGIPGRSSISIADVGPHVQDLGKLLSAMGAKVTLEGPNMYSIEGSASLHGATHHIIGDMLDAFTFMIAGLVTRGEVTVTGVQGEQLELPLLKLQEMGARVTVSGDSLTTFPHSGTFTATDIETRLFPGVLSDLQPLFVLLMTQAEGTSLIHETMYENRFRYLEELSRMGADATVLNPQRAVVKGPTPLVGIPITSFDIRAGAVLVLAGLVAQGETTIEGVDHIDRGYEDIDGRLRLLGADIERVTS